MDRREFFKLVAACGITIWLPGIMHNSASYRPQLPRGLGIGMNVFTFADPEPALATAIALLQPNWFYHWRQWPPSNHAGFLPMIHPTPNAGNPPYPLNVQTIDNFRQAMATVGGNIETRCWLMGNEPELSGWTPNQAVDAVVAQVAVLRSAGLDPVIIAPNGNITVQEHMAYLIAWCEAADRAGLAYTLGIHVYAHTVSLLDHWWREFSSWWQGRGDVIVTECGAGANRTMADWLTVMPWFYNLVDSGQVRALAPFAAYPYTHQVHNHYPGMIQDGTLNDLGQQWPGVVGRLIDQ